MVPIERQEAISLMQRADLLMLDGDNVTARNLLVKAVEIDPTNAEARRMLGGLTARMAGVRLEDMPAGRRYLASEANDLVEAAKQARMDGQYELAESLCRRALTIDPANEDAKHGLIGAQTVQSQITYHDIPTAPSLPNQGWHGQQTAPLVAATFGSAFLGLRFIVGTVLGYMLITTPSYRHGMYHPPMAMTFHLNPVVVILISLTIGVLAMVGRRR